MLSLVLEPIGTYQKGALRSHVDGLQCVFIVYLFLTGTSPVSTPSALRLTLCDVLTARRVTVRQMHINVTGLVAMLS